MPRMRHAFNPHLTKTRLNDAPHLCEMLPGNLRAQHQRGTWWNCCGRRVNEYEYRCVSPCGFRPQEIFPSSHSPASSRQRRSRRPRAGLCVDRLQQRIERRHLPVDERSCGTKVVMRQVRDAMSAILDHTTIADVNRTVKIAEDGLRQPDEELMYYI